MANPAMKPGAPPPAADDDDTGMDAGGAGGDDAGGDEDEVSQGTVIATIIDNGDGSYTLVHGSPDDMSGGDGEAGGEATMGGGVSEGGTEGEEGDKNAPAGGADMGGEGDEGPMQEHFDNPGALMKGILDILNESEAQSGGGENAFAAGFNESKNPTPKQ